MSLADLGYSSVARALAVRDLKGPGSSMNPPYNVWLYGSNNARAVDRVAPPPSGRLKTAPVRQL